MAAVMALFFAGVAPAMAQDDDASKKQMAEALGHLKKWIWDPETHDKQTVRFWRAFTIPPQATVSMATIYITVDNGYRLFLDGREIGQGSDWKTVSEYRVESLLKPGEHVLSVEAFNERLAAGLIFALNIEMPGKPPLEITSDESWQVVPLDEKRWMTEREVQAGWHAAVVVGKAGVAPWKPWPYAIVSLPPLLPVKLYFWQEGWFQVMTLSLLGAALLVCLRLVTQLGARRKAEQLLNRQRTRIARDIHDDLGVRLTQLVLLGELAQNELPPESASRDQIRQICEQARDLGHAMDEIVWAVSSRRDTLRDFAAFVCKYTQWFCQNTEIRSRFDVEDELPPTPFDLVIRRNLLLAVKEAINNAVKHSGASELFIRIHRNGDELLVEVDDNGRGFQVSQADWMRNGLTNMSERMEEAGGKFTIYSAPGRGCRIAFQAPLTMTRVRWRWLDRLWPEANQQQNHLEESDNGSFKETQTTK
jgi:signal transduction histidine kinase